METPERAPAPGATVTFPAQCESCQRLLRGTRVVFAPRQLDAPAAMASGQIQSKAVLTRATSVQLPPSVVWSHSRRVPSAISYTPESTPASSSYHAWHDSSGTTVGADDGK